MWGWLSRSLEENRVLIGIQGKSWEWERRRWHRFRAWDLPVKAKWKGDIFMGSQGPHMKSSAKENWGEAREKVEVKTGVEKGEPGLLTLQRRLEML